MKFFILFIVVQLSLTMLGIVQILDKLDAYEMGRLGCIVSKTEIEELGFCRKGDKKCK